MQTWVTHVLDVFSTSCAGIRRTTSSTARLRAAMLRATASRDRDLAGVNRRRIECSGRQT